MTLIEKERDLLILHNINKAEACLKEIEILIDNNLFSTAINRIYYGIFYILSALALKEHFETSKHLQLIGWFNKNFIKTGKLDKNLGEILHQAYDLRAKGDYGNFVTFTKEQTVSAYQDMKFFVETLKNFIKV